MLKNTRARANPKEAFKGCAGYYIKNGIKCGGNSNFYYTDLAVVVSFCSDILKTGPNGLLEVRVSDVAAHLRLVYDDVGQAFEIYSATGLVEKLFGDTYQIERQTLDFLKSRVLDPEVLPHGVIKHLNAVAGKVILGIIRYRLSNLERRLER